MSDGAAVPFSEQAARWLYGFVSSLAIATYPGNAEIKGNLVVDGTLTATGGFVPPASSLPSPNPRQFGALGGVNDDTTAVNNAIAFALATGQTDVFLYGGPYRCKSDVLLPVGASGGPTINLRGPGWNMPALIFDGAGVTHGLYSNGNASTFPYASSIENLSIQLVNNAVCAIDDFGLNTTVRKNIRIQGGGANGPGIISTNVNVPVWQETQIANCGSATTAQVEFASCTNVVWRGRIETGAAGCQAGLKLDNVAKADVTGDVESCGVCVMVGSKTGANANSSISVNIDGENPTDHYVEAGYGPSATVKGLTITGTYSPSGATTVPYGIKLKNTTGTRVKGDISLGQLATLNAITAGTFVSGTGVLTLTTTTPHGIPVGGLAPLNALTGTGSFALFNGTWVAIAGTTGSTLVLQCPVGIPASAITGGNVQTNAIASIWLEGATNLGTVVEASAGNSGNTWPWVVQNGLMVSGRNRHAVCGSSIRRKPLLDRQALSQQSAPRLPVSSFRNRAASLVRYSSRRAARQISSLAKARSAIRE